MFRLIKTIWDRTGRLAGELPDLPLDCCDTRGGRRVMLALELIKSQRRSIDLNARANQGFIENFRQKLRQTAQARKLCALRRDLPLWQRAYYYNSWVINLAACFLLVFISRVNFSMFTRVGVSYSQEKVSQIYASKCGGDKDLLEVYSVLRYDDDSEQTII